MGTIFSATLLILRKEGGFKTAYSFFHDNGGKPVLKISYRMYLLTEQGKLLPPFRMLGTYLCALRIPLRSYSAMVFIEAWLKTTLGEDDFKHLLAPFFKLPQQNSINSPLHKAAKILLNQKKSYLNPEQMRVIAENSATSLCWIALSKDSGAWTPKTLAAELKLSSAVTETTMKKLAGVKLLKRLNDGTYKCPLAGAMVEYPHGANTDPAMRNKFHTLRDGMISSGQMTYLRCGVVRASLTELANCFPLLALNLSIAETYAVTKKQKDSALFGVLCKVVKIRDF